jgi:hypothetical protein
LAETERQSDQRLLPLCEKLGWNATLIQNIIPLYDYFLEMRNCVVHRAGRANEGIINLARSNNLDKCMQNWPLEADKHLPELPNLKNGGKIELLPRHAVLASIVCHHAAIQLNKKLIEFLGDQGVVYMTAHHALFGNDRIPRFNEKSADRLINNILTNRYRVTSNSTESVIRILKELDVWKVCQRRFGELYADTN